MAIDAILASKMYRSSPRKSAIRAAMSNPINFELVQQLENYLDEAYVAPPVVPESGSPVGDGAIDRSPGGAPSSDSSSASARSSGGVPSGGGFSGLSSELPDGPGGSDDLGDDPTVPDDEGPSDEGVVDSEPAVQSDEPAEASIVLSSVQIPSIADIPGELKGTLNARQDTAGVDRVYCKDSEVWIYYNDKINLNNIMTPVIELLNAANYNYLTFNRLARSDNAVVFELSIVDTVSEVQPLEPDEGEDGK